MKRAALVGSEYRIGIGRKSDMEERTGGEKMEASTSAGNRTSFGFYYTFGVIGHEK